MNPEAMDATFESIEKVVFSIIKYTALAIEVLGAVVLVFAIGRALFQLCKRDFNVRLRLAQGIALALEFKIGGELLRTVYVSDWKELAMLGAVILIRAAMTFLIHWEIRIHKKDSLQMERSSRPLKKNKKEKTADTGNELPPPDDGIC